MKYNIFSITELGIDVSSGVIPEIWQELFFAAGTPGHIPLDKFSLNDEQEVIMLIECEPSMLNDADGNNIGTAALVYQTDSDSEYQAWLEANADIDFPELPEE